ncbi:MAG: gamma-glutamyl-gamma-aminobutyrate hydrolase family protein [Actinobacteria bacterium]|nr:gamma-glutamyl-gamma-aminobutyrate hydrolase family protein [Actinomycetota bacterium]
MRPLIGITAGHRSITSAGADERAHVLYAAYTRKVREAGGLPVILTPVPQEDVPGLLDRIDGLVMTGGGDVDPNRYGGTTHPAVYGVDAERDSFELALADEAALRRLPMLAICRGMQVVNVARGGTLIEDIATHDPEALPHQVTGEAAYQGVQVVTVAEGSSTAAALGATTLRVNSVHHQAVRDLAPGFRITATTSDGMIEAYEPIDAAWPLLAVQWHPEWLTGDDSSHRLFATLVATAGRAMASGTAGALP